MAKKKKLIEEQRTETFTKRVQSLEPVANCNHLEEVDANSCSGKRHVGPSGDHSEKGEVALSQHDIEKLIITVRGEQVLIDRDLAYVYQVEVKQMNRQVKRNIERFPEDFMFQLTKDEYNSLKCQNGTSNKRGGDHRALPYAFTQQGVGMLSGLLRSQVAEWPLCRNETDGNSRDGAGDVEMIIVKYKVQLSTTIVYGILFKNNTGRGTQEQSS